MSFCLSKYKGTKIQDLKFFEGKNPKFHTIVKRKNYLPKNSQSKSKR